MDVTALEHAVDRDVDAVPRARRFTAEALRGVDSSIVDDVELVVSELVTNALLHGAAPVTLRLSTIGDRVRIEVEDGGRELPVRMRDDTDAMTGRGLALVSRLSNGWGVEPGEGRGKVVWAEVADSEDGGDAEDSELDVDALLAAWSDDEEDAEPTHVVELGAVPTDLLIEAKAHIDNLVREFTLAAGGAAADQPTALPPDLAELVQTVVHGFSIARSSIKRQALEAAARGDAETKLTLTLPVSAADAGEKYLDALDEADGYARAARLLTLETPPVHRVFRRWYVESIIAQLRRHAAGEPPAEQQTFLQRLAGEYTQLAPMQAVAQRLALLQRVTAELTGAPDVAEVCQVVVANATRVLGARSAGIYLLGDDRVFRLAAADGHDGAVPGYESFPAAASLPGGDALRAREPVVIRNLADLAERYPALGAVYAEERTLLVAPLVVGDHELGVLSLTFADQGSIDERTQLTLLTTLADVSAQALERAMATSAATAATDRLAFLAEASVVLSSSLDYRTVLASVAGLVVPRLADWCAIQLLENDTLETVALTHFDPAKAAWASRMGERYPTDMTAPSGAPNVIRTGASELYPDIPAELIEAAAVDEEHLRILRELGICSGLVVPLTGRTGTFGALTMVHAESGRHYGEEDVAFAEDLARRAALAVETAHAFREQSGRLAEVTRVAEAAQHAILAAPPAQIGPVALAARYVSAAAEALIGGDLFEVVERPESVRLLIGDVRGKGLDAVRTATVVLGEFRAAASDIDELAQVAVQIDRRVRRYLTDEDFVTAALAEIGNDGSFTLVSCGHPPALVLGEDGVTAVATEACLPLGLGATPIPVNGYLRPGERLFLYTDGIIEARDRQGQFVDLHRLLAPVSGDDLDTTLERVLTDLRSAVGGALADDLAMLVAEYRGRPPSAQATH
ncbi:MAG TPA: SpoIIE family protein phosphatase [Mycobacteriales bacterium]|nr:SpoIIE family protein phosphatase [Mycobacteriales bacterium]